ncbi:DUF2695 domain-containing protein [Geodermatophilus sp. URMC 64]
MASTDWAARAPGSSLLLLDRVQLIALLAHVDSAVASDGCGLTRAATDAWAVRAGVDPARLHAGLEEYGGFCDCEVVMNVDVDEVFPPVGSPRS